MLFKFNEPKLISKRSFLIKNFYLDRYFIDGKLSIFGVQAADEGHFTCQATNKLLKKSIHLPIAIGKYCRVYLYIESLLSLLTFPSWTIFN